jgi:phosphotransferase system  glucose/maltose/N-acetylglucosamine-specific IIC component
MNVFNRLFTIVTIVLLIIFGAALLITPATVLGLIHSASAAFRTSVPDPAPRLALRVLAAIIFVLIMLGLLWLELRRPAVRTIEVGRYTGGTTIKISTDAVESKVRDAIDNLPGVIGSKVGAIARSKAVDVRLAVLATKDTDLVGKAEEIAALTRMIIQDQLGLKLHGKPQVTIKAGAGKARIDRKPMIPTFGPRKPEIAAPKPDVDVIDGKPSTP